MLHILKFIFHKKKMLRRKYSINFPFAISLLRSSFERNFCILRAVDIARLKFFTNVQRVIIYFAGSQKTPRVWKMLFFTRASITFFSIESLRRCSDTPLDSLSPAASCASGTVEILQVNRIQMRAPSSTPFIQDHIKWSSLLC